MGPDACYDKGGTALAKMVVTDRAPQMRNYTIA